MKLSKIATMTMILFLGLSAFCFSADLTGVWDVTTEVPGEEPVTQRLLIIQDGDEFTLGGIPGKIRNEKYLVMGPLPERTLFRGVWIQIDKITFKAKDDNNYVGKTFLSVYDFKDSIRKVFSNDTMQTGVRVIDAPAIISLKGAAEVWAAKGADYADPGAGAFEETGNDITDKLVVKSTVDVNKPGTYTVTYNVVGSNGKAADEVSRTVHVVAEAPPVMTMKGDAVLEVQKGDGYVDNGATATNYLNEDITGTIKITVNGEAADPNAIDITKSGADYEIVYSVSDDYGTAQTTRKVTVMQRDDEQSFFKYCFISNIMD
jgi:hypothetical protein